MRSLQKDLNLFGGIRNVIEDHKENPDRRAIDDFYWDKEEFDYIASLTAEETKDYEERFPVGFWIFKDGVTEKKRKEK